MRWQKIYFDLDNTLFSYEYAFENAIQDCFQQLVDDWYHEGISIPNIASDDWFDVFKYFSDFFWSDYEEGRLSQIDYRRKRYNETMRHFNMPVSDQDADKFHQQFYQHALDYVQPYPGLHRLLSFLLEKGVQLGIITNGKHKLQMAKIHKLRLQKYISDDNIFVSECVGVAKPNAAIFHRAHRPNQKEKALFVGDSWELDVVGAIDAGWQAIYLNTQSRPVTTQHQPIAQFRHLLQLSVYLKQYYK